MPQYTINCNIGLYFMPQITQRCPLLSFQQMGFFTRQWHYFSSLNSWECSSWTWGQGLSGTPLVHKFFRSPLFLPSVKIKKYAQTHSSSDYVGKAKMKLQYRTEKNQPAKQNVFHSCPPQNLIHRTKVQKLGEKVL